jgi:hypothetical protein
VMIIGYSFGGGHPRLSHFGLRRLAADPRSPCFSTLNSFRPDSPNVPFSSTIRPVTSPVSF